MCQSSELLYNCTFITVVDYDNAMSTKYGLLITFKKKKNFNVFVY